MPGTNFHKEHRKFLDEKSPDEKANAEGTEGEWQLPKRTAKPGVPQPTAGIILSREFHVFHPTEDDCPMDSPV